MKFAIILNSLLYPVPRTHGMHVRKLFEGFRQNGFVVIEASNINDISDSLGRESVVYVSNHFINERNKILPLDLEEKLLRKIRNSKVQWLLWGFHQAGKRDKFADLKNVLFLKERFYDELMNSNSDLSFYRQVRFYDLKYSSFVDPRFDYKASSRVLGCFFAGSKYKEEYNLEIRNLTQESEILYYPPRINEIDRISGFKRFTHSLVWHSDANIEKGIIVERFPEAMSLGGMIIHDHKRIELEYKGLHKEFVTSKEDLTTVLSNLKWDEDLSRSNFEFWRKSDLSYYQQVKNILDELSRI
jgi:hypothetical protein